jgi:hypothetical protein
MAEWLGRHLFTPPYYGQIAQNAARRESFVRIHSVTRIRILFFYHSIVRFNPAEESRQLEN